MPHILVPQAALQVNGSGDIRPYPPLDRPLALPPDKLKTNTSPPPLLLQANSPVHVNSFGDRNKLDKSKAIRLCYGHVPYTSIH